MAYVQLPRIAKVISTQQIPIWTYKTHTKTHQYHYNLPPPNKFLFDLIELTQKPINTTIIYLRKGCHHLILVKS